MPGTVTVFNCYNEPVTSLSVSGGTAGDIDAWSDGGPGQPPKYTPAERSVPRSKYKTQGQFAVGDNAVQIPWNSFSGAATVTIPDPTKVPISLDDPLILMVCTNQAALLTTRGFVQATFPVTLTMSVRQLAAYRAELALEHAQLDPLPEPLSSWLNQEGIVSIDLRPKVRDGEETGELAVTVGVASKKPLDELGPDDLPIPPNVELEAPGDEGSPAVTVPTDVVEV